MSPLVRRLEGADVGGVVALGLRAWAPVFAGLEAELGPQVFGLLFPDWRSAQATAIEAVCTAPDNDVWVAAGDDRVVGFVAMGLIDEDAARAVEIHMIAVDPVHQGAGVGALLMRRAVSEIRAKGVGLAVVATGGDRGHAPARALYEKLDFRPLHLVRYYRTL